MFPFSFGSVGPCHSQGSWLFKVWTNFLFIFLFWSFFSCLFFLYNQQPKTKTSSPLHLYFPYLQQLLLGNIQFVKCYIMFMSFWWEILIHMSIGFSCFRHPILQPNVHSSFGLNISQTIFGFVRRRVKEIQISFWWVGVALCFRKPVFNDQNLCIFGHFCGGFIFVNQ